MINMNQPHMKHMFTVYIPIMCGVQPCSHSQWTHNYWYLLGFNVMDADRQTSKAQQLTNDAAILPSNLFSACIPTPHKLSILSV